MTGHISEAIRRWADEVAALGGGEPLIRFRDSKVGTLDLSAADDPSRKKLVEGEPVRISRLFPHDPLRTTTARSARRLAERLWQLEAGHGIAAGYLVTGLASWSPTSGTKRPNVPILMRRLQVEPTGFAEPDLLLHAVGEAELNTRLLDEMADQLGLRLTPADLLDPSGELRYPVVVDRLREQAPPHVVDGFAISHRAVIGLMTSIADDVARDLTDAVDHFGDQPLVALAAGAPARLPSMPADTDTSGVDESRPTPIDLDSAQRRVLDAVRAGSSVAVHTPAGTGATQVAAGLCAEAVGDGRSVLVVAESSPRLHGLRRRLAAVGLGGATLDLADGLVSTHGIARDVLSTINGATRRPDTGADEATQPPGLDAAAAERDKALLTSYVTALHGHRAPQALSAYQAISAAHAGAADQRAQVRLDAHSLEALDAASLERLRSALAEFITLDGLSISVQATAWFGAAPASPEDAEQAVALVDRLRRDLLPRARDSGARAAVEVGMPTPSTMADLAELSRLLSGVHEVESVFSREVWAEPVERMAAATADRKQRRGMADGPGLRERRTLRNRAGELARPAAREDVNRQSSALAMASDVATSWGQRAHDGRLPRTGETSAAAVAAFTAVAEAVQALQQVHPQALPDDLDLAGVAARLGVLGDEVVWARRLPRLTATATELADAGMGPVVAELRARREGGQAVTPETAVAVLDSCVAASLAAQIEEHDPVLSATRGEDVRAAGKRWRQADAAAVVAASDEVRAAWTRGARSAASERPVQVRALRDALSGRSASSTRDLLDASWATVRAARPIWLAGALPAGAALPLDATFDLVIVLDGHCVALAHAIGALGRTEQVVVLGDPAQLPPSPTPLSVDAPDARSASAAPGSGIETPSVFAVLRDQLPGLELSVRYGCRDARLEVAMPTRRNGSPLAVAPGVAATSPLRLHHVLQEPGSRDQEESVSAEVGLVVDLVRRHAAGRPSASLAVLTLGRAHADAIEAALARACLTDAELATAIGPTADEPFLLRCVDDLNGERRDAVILSVGYGRTMDGRLLYRYGSLNRPGGLRWLSAAISTARRDLSVVSSVTASDLEPRRLAADGLRGLRQLLATAEWLALDGLDDPADHPALTPRKLDPLERSIAEAVHGAGMPVLAGSGSGSLATAMGVEHPGRPGRGVLVIEPEGAPFSELHHLRDRERIRPEQLMRAGWSVHRVCTVDWLRDPDAEVRRIRQAWDEACDLADALDAARNAPAGVSAGADDAADDVAAQVGPRPVVAVGRPVESYPLQDLVALADWVQDATPGMSEDDVVVALGRETGLAHPTGRTETVLRGAVKAAEIARRGHVEPMPAEPDRSPEATSAPALDVESPLPVMSAADERERSAEQLDEDRSREAWLNDERPPHHEG